MRHTLGCTRSSTTATASWRAWKTVGFACSPAAATGWTEQFPRIREALAALRARSATIDGEAVVCCPKTGLSLFDLLHSGRHDREVILYAFDLLELNGKDWRALSLAERKARLGDLLMPVTGGIALSEHIEADGATVFRKPAGSAARGSCRSSAPRLIDRVGCGRGSR
jgi:hypothetical protein